ncbi:MAG: 50S ribosomal protein L4 [Dehalococcoidia bacterium]|nr:MAG: 50S ribosomal protein L4 [Dehalococcoidia bacterium]
MQVQVYNLKGEVVSQIEVGDDVFGVPFNEAVVHQALVRQLANRRQGTADTKTRGEVRGSTRKLFAQKHTGRARRGDKKSPLLRGGGVAFGPHPRSYRQAMPKKMRRLALRCVLSAKVSDGEVKVVDRLELDEPKTKGILDILLSLGVGTSALIATAGTEANVVKSARNLLGVKTTPASLLNVADLLSYRTLIVTVAAVRRMEELWGQKPTQEVATSAT